MSFGLSIEGANQRILLNESNPGIYFKGKYTASYSSSGWIKTITGCNTMPLVFIKNLGDGYKTCIQAQDNLGNGSWTIYATAARDSSSGTTYTGDLDLYVFDILGSADAVTSGYGMLVYDNNSTPVFTTNKKLLKITGYHNTSYVESSGSEYNISIQTLTNGTIPTDYAMHCASVGTVWYAAGASTSLLLSVGARRYSSTSLKFGATGLLRPFNPAPYTQSFMQANHHLLFINHTDYD